MMHKPGGLPSSPQAQQQHQNVINRVLAARSGNGMALTEAAKLSDKAGPPQLAMKIRELDLDEQRNKP
jgi:hypothetical protein